MATTRSRPSTLACVWRRCTRSDSERNGVGRHADGQHHQVAAVVGQVGGELREADAFLGGPIDGGQCGRRFAIDDGIDEQPQQFVRHGAEHEAHIGFGDRPGGEGRDLLQQGQRIAQGAIGLQGDEAGGIFFEREAFAARDVLEPAGDIGRADAPKIEALTTRGDGGRHFVGIGGGEHEDGVRGRFFERLEQRVKG